MRNHLWSNGSTFMPENRKCPPKRPQSVALLSITQYITYRKYYTEFGESYLLALSLNLEVLLHNGESVC